MNSLPPNPPSGWFKRASVFSFVFLGLVLGTSPARAQSTVIIDVYNFDFGDAANNIHINPTIEVGDTIRWRWVSGFHSTTSVQGQIESWNSGGQFPAFTFDHTFTNVGTFIYFCDFHGFDNFNGTATGMSGSVIVTAPVPEPSSILLVGGLIGAVGLVARRKPKRAAFVRRNGRRTGTSALELLCVVSILSVVAGLVIPAVQSARESANYLSCRNNLKQLGLAIHNYEAATGTFPGPGTPPHQHSPLVSLLPYLGLDSLSRSLVAGDPLFIPIGDYGRLKESQAEAARTVIKQFLCPSDPLSPVTAGYDYAELAGTNYAFNAGTGTKTFYDFRHPTDGVFWYGSRLRAGEIRDGISSTIFAAEVLRGQGFDSFRIETADPRRTWMSMSCTTNPASNQPGTNPPLTAPSCMANTLGMIWRGDRNVSWVGGPGHRSLFNTFHMPNEAMSDCGSFGLGWYKSASNHSRIGVNIVLGDGSVHFIKNHIAGDLWRALSTRDDREVIGSYCGCH